LRRLTLPSQGTKAIRSFGMTTAVLEGVQKRRGRGAVVVPRARALLRGCRLWAPSRSFFVGIQTTGVPQKRRTMRGRPMPLLTVLLTISGEDARVVDRNNHRRQPCPTRPDGKQTMPLARLSTTPAPL
ncbi:unnamed protein product, partial [Scytosiphon promiscuus]